MNEIILEADDLPYYNFFLFINSGSGGGLGQQLVKQQIKKLEFQIPIRDKNDIKEIHIFFINMRDQTNRKYGFNKLAQINVSNRQRFDYGKKSYIKDKKLMNQTMAIVCGGDGSVMWVVEQFLKHSINFEETPIGIIPVGTGNDFSRSLNWGPQKTMLLQYHYRSLKKLIRKWLHAQVMDFDLWDVEAEIFENGKFQKRNGDKLSVNLGTNIFKKTFCNYFSFGIDGKVGYTFDKYRAKSRIGNLAVYGGIGLTKSLGKTKPINDFIQSFHVEIPDKEKKMTTSDYSPRSSKLMFRSKSKPKLQTKNSKKEQDEDLKQGLMNILALNINSYTGGTKDIWKNAKEVSKKNIQQRVQPSFSDGKIEIVSFGSGIGIAMEKIFGGMSNRLAQDQGPFVFNFRRYPQNQNHRTYLQIDGQFIRFTHPKSIILKHSQLVPNGKIKVIYNDENFVPYQPEC